MTRERDPFRIPSAGWEAAPAAGLASIDINANGGSFGQGEMVAESSLGGLMTPAPQRPWLAALLGRQGDQLADSAQIAALQERLQRHGAELQGQLPELLLRSPDPQASIEAWLMGRDLSHWQPQAWGGSATDGWQFEAAGLNRARGAEPMNASDIAAAHVDGGFEALLTGGVPEGIALEMGEAALIAAVLQLAWLLTQRQREAGCDPSDSGHSAQAVHQTLAGTALNGAAWSVVVSMALALALVPGGQLWLALLTTQGLLQALPWGKKDPFAIPVGEPMALTGGSQRH